MKFSVYVFSNEISTGKLNFDIVSLHKFFAMHDCKCQKLVFFDFDKEKNWEELQSSLAEDENQLILMENCKIDDFTFERIALLGKYVGTIDEQALLFEKDGKKLAFLPVDENWQTLLDKIVKLKEGKKVYQFKVFGRPIEEVEGHLKDLQSCFDGLEYSIFYDNLICEIYLSYFGKYGEIDEVQMQVASKFKDELFSENGMEIEKAILQCLRLKNVRLAIFDGATGGHLINKLNQNQNFDEVLKVCKVESDICKPTSDGLYDFCIKSLDNSDGDVVLALTKKETGDAEEYLFAIADKKAVHMFKNKFSSADKVNKAFATNSALFQLLKKLKQNDFAF